MDAIGQIIETGTFDGSPVDFLDGTVFGVDELYLTVGSFSDVAPWTSDYTRQKIYYQSVRSVREDFLTIRDYLWRWDTDWFWCSRPFGVQHPLIRRLWPRRYRRSDVYRRLIALDQRHHLTDRLRTAGSAPLSSRASGTPSSRASGTTRETVIQDVEIPVERGADFLRFFHDEIGMSPIWICPLRLRADHSWPLYPIEPGRGYVNFGFWGTVPRAPGQRGDHYNRLIEDEVTALDGHKSLYSTASYSEEQFWSRYNGPAYRKLKHRYDPAGRLLDLYEKCVRER
jgi:FAD/FMN-containing dehydrogenase